MFILENHLSTDQNRVIAEVQAAASVANFSLFLAGGAMRDMLGGFQIRDLDFVVEGNPGKLAKILHRQGRRAHCFERRAPPHRGADLSRRRDRRDRHVPARKIRPDWRPSAR
jgi:tRNA nucleotidyltransferase/poly(A) polymerase